MEPITVTDQDLLARYINGDKASFEALINRHKNKVFSYIYITVRNQTLAEDIFQDTFIKVIKSLEESKYRDDGKFVSWVMRIAHNLIIDHFRKARQMNLISDSACEGTLFNSRKFSDDTIEDLIIDEQISNDVRKLIDYLPDDQREVVMLRHYADMSFKEIADNTNVSINTALGRMRYALLNLRKLILEKELILSR